MTNKLSAEYDKALKLHHKIKMSAQAVQQDLWDMCTGLKEMRDGKLYKELGYQNFEQYCDTEFNMSAGNARKYISIIENISEENRSTLNGFGMGKLYLLSTLSEADQQKITADNDVESMTVKELEAQIKELKGQNRTLEFNINQKKTEVQSLQDLLKDGRDVVTSLISDRERLKDKVRDLEDEVTVLRTRPIDVTATEQTDEVRQLKETIKHLEISTERQLDDLQNEHLKDVQEIHKQHAEELGEALAEQRHDYEERIGELERQIEEGGSDTKVVRSLFDNIGKDTMNRFQSLALYAYNHTRDIATLRGEVYALIEEEQEFLNSLYGGRE